MRSALALASTFLLAVLPLTSAADDDIRVCWGFDGKDWANNVLCPGSQTCCGEHGTCLPNKLCNSKKDGTGELIRGPCAAVPYDKEECGEICLYDEIDNRFPRVTICEDGTYCCNNDKQCCEAGRGVTLNAAGKVVAKSVSSSTGSKPSTLSTSTKSPSTTSDQPPSTSDSSTLDSANTSSETPTPSADAETTSPSESAASSEPTAAGGMATGAKVGVGVGVPVAVLGAAALGAFLFFRRRRTYSPAGNSDYKPPQAQELGATESPQEMQAFPKEQNNIPIELPADEAPGMKAAKVDYKPYVRGG